MRNVTKSLTKHNKYCINPLCVFVGFIFVLFLIMVFIVFLADKLVKDRIEKEKDDIVQVGNLDNENSKPSIEVVDSKSNHEMLQYINDNKNLYNERLVELANSNEELLEYVYNYPIEAEKHHVINVKSEADNDNFPYFCQWDTRWGYIPYGDGMIGYTGCGPTCLSMVAVYLTGDAAYTPDYVAAYAENNGYSVYGNGTSWTLMSEGCKAFGILSEEVCLDKNVMIQQINSGKPIICAMGPGDFTKSGHYIVINGYEEDGFVVYDPNSPIKSNRHWTYEEISEQINNIWAFNMLDE